MRNVLFLCTGNSARSILAEAVLNRLGEGRFRAHSAGSVPKGAVHPLALAALAEAGYATTGLHSKSWEAFARPGGPPLDIVITLCDAAAAEPCPIWPGRPAMAHWGVPDPAAVKGDEITRRAAFAEALQRLVLRIQALLDQPVESLDEATLARRLSAIGTMP